jgi:hypothetical protein
MTCLPQLRLFVTSRISGLAVGKIRLHAVVSKFGYSAQNVGSWHG